MKLLFSSLGFLIALQAWASDTCSVDFELLHMYFDKRSGLTIEPEILDYKNNRQGLPINTFTAAEIIPELADDVPVEAQKGLFNASYERTVMLKKGDRIKIDDEQEVELGEFLGRGDSTHIFALKNEPGKVIRIPYFSEKVQRDNIQKVRFLYKQFWNSYHDLEDSGLPLLETEKRGRFIVQKRMANPQTAMDFAAKLMFKDKMSAEESLRANKLIDLILDLRNKPELGDVRMANIAWDKDRWVIFDWNFQGACQEKIGDWCKGYRTLLSEAEIFVGKFTQGKRLLDQIPDVWKTKLNQDKKNLYKP